MEKTKEYKNPLIATYEEAAEILKKEEIKKQEPKSDKEKLDEIKKSIIDLKDKQQLAKNQLIKYETYIPSSPKDKFEILKIIIEIDDMFDEIVKLTNKNWMFEIGYEKEKEDKK